MRRWGQFFDLFGDFSVLLCTYLLATFSVPFICPFLDLLYTSVLFVPLYSPFYWRMKFFELFGDFSVPFLYLCTICTSVQPLLGSCYIYLFNVLFWIFYIPLYYLYLCIAPFRILLYNNNNNKCLRGFRKYRRIYTSDVPETDLLLLFREVSSSFTQKGSTVFKQFSLTREGLDSPR